MTIPTTLPPGVAPNITDNRDNFYISYNPVDTGIYGDVTTAIVTTLPGDSQRFYILMGNHRDALADLTLDQCLDYFRSNRDQWSDKTEDPDRPIDWAATVKTGKTVYVNGGAA